MACPAQTGNETRIKAILQQCIDARLQTQPASSDAPQQFVEVRLYAATAFRYQAEGNHSLCLNFLTQIKLADQWSCGVFCINFAD